LYFQQLQSRQKTGGWLEMNRANACCFGSGMESNAKYTDSIYFNDGKSGLFVNLFIPSTLDWAAQRVKVKQATNYPDEGATRLEFTCEKPVELTVNVRHPWWARAGFAITVNGEKQGDAGAPGSFVPLNRTWKSGDVVAVSMPMAFYTEGFKDNPKRVAVMYGPLVMAAETEAGNRLSAIVAEDERFLAGLKPVAGKALEFTAPGAVFRTSKETVKENVSFRPLLRMVDETYAVYWDQVNAAEFAEMPVPTRPATNPR
jgi:DUF1680 family protein